MNLRIRRKIANRNNIRRYRDYKEYINITAPANMAYEDFIKRNPQYKDTHNMIHIVRNKSKSHPRIMKLTVLADCYPAAVSTGTNGEVDVQFQGMSSSDLDALNDNARKLYDNFMSRMKQGQVSLEEESADGKE